jgi:hypothetical protein
VVAWKHEGATHKLWWRADRAAVPSWTAGIAGYAGPRWGYPVRRRRARARRRAPGWDNSGPTELQVTDDAKPAFAREQSTYSSNTHPQEAPVEDEQAEERVAQGCSEEIDAIHADAVEIRIEIRR